jgi:hypothetical protein
MLYVTFTVLPAWACFKNFLQGNLTGRSKALLQWALRAGRASRIATLRLLACPMAVLWRPG